MDTYSLLRQFADSWALLALFLFFVGSILFVLRPGSRRIHEAAARSILRDDARPPRDGAPSGHDASRDEAREEAV
ncbi:Cbb3-type cytochrome oxidase component FixQ [Roseivivax jejudonensis]|uniref:Cbb3-type cytochrome oxidase component FixQ n=1 Tax=Roseivivax jejudonensis TaxID=1529041 RepID=A0A1X6ZBV0_9RHOB|nr:cbb3-type cytochrome c oxidase subunit 3 [Roseivivax jejudonensis]SLN46637.1 Cbb3-type cytochrome oxidase component FixQ [Roseivivax jejudonensis]